MAELPSMRMSVVLQAIAREYVKSDDVAAVIAEQALRIMSDDPSLLDGSIDVAIRNVIHRLALDHLNDPVVRPEGLGNNEDGN